MPNMTRLDDTFTSGTLFKTLFVRRTELLKGMLSMLLGIDPGSIGEFAIINLEMPPENLGDNFCRLGINMTIEGRRVDLEIQVGDKGDYPERRLFFLVRKYTSALAYGTGCHCEKQFYTNPFTFAVTMVRVKLSQLFAPGACHEKKFQVIAHIVCADVWHCCPCPERVDDLL